MTINLLEPTIPDQKVSSVWQRSSRFITCLFCGLRGRQVGDSPLCSNCLIDPVQTRTAIYLQMHNIEQHEERAGAAWLALCEQHLTFWEKLLAKRKEAPDTDARARAAHPTYAKLLDAEDAYYTAMQPLGLERARLEKALTLLEEL